VPLDIPTIKEASRRVRMLQVALVESDPESNKSIHIEDSTLKEEVGVQRIIARVSWDDLLELGVHWLPEEDESDYMTVTYLLCKQLVERGDYRNWFPKEVLDAVRWVCHPDKSNPAPQIETVLQPLSD
jgi:hypothetical protein